MVVGTLDVQVRVRRLTVLLVPVLLLAHFAELIGRPLSDAQVSKIAGWLARRCPIEVTPIEKKPG